jgi:proline iminopeptidase
MDQYGRDHDLNLHLREEIKMVTRRQFLWNSVLAAGVSILTGTVGLESTVAAWIPEPHRAGYIPVKGGRIWYRLNGAKHFVNGKTPIIAIHGGPGFSHHYLLPIIGLADDRPVILYDQLDCGYSDKPNDPSNWKVERFVSEINDLREALGLDRVIIFGNSWGGTVAAEYAISQPAGLVATILSSPLISTKRWIADNTEHRRQLPEDIQKTLDKHEAAGTIDSQEYQEAVMVFYRRHLCRMEPWPDELNRSFEIFSPDLYVTMWGNTEFNCSGTLKDYDASDRLKQIQVPVLYTCGEYDESTPAANRDFAALTPNAEVKVIPDASHVAFLEKREEYLQTIQNFLSRLD